MGSGRFISGLVLALGLFASAARAAPVIKIYVSYYDTEHPSSTQPNPWLGSPGTTFLGAPDGNGIFDTGAILLINQGPGDAVIGPGLKVDGFANGASFQIWDGDLGTGRTVLAGQNMIFAQKGSGTFDTSDQPIITDPNQRTNDKPVVHLSVNGTAYSFTDNTQVLNTGGFDPGEAFHTSESLPWTQIGTIPEPSALLQGTAIVCLLALRRRLTTRKPTDRCPWAS